MGDEKFVKFPDHLSFGAHVGTMANTTAAGLEAEWGFLKLGNAISLNLGFSYDQSLSPASRPESSLWGTDVKRYAGHLGIDYRLVLFPGKTVSLGITPLVRFFFGAQSYSPHLSEDPATLRAICEKYGRFGSSLGDCTHPERLEPYPKGAPNGTEGLVGLGAGANLFISIDGNKIVSGLGWLDFSLGVYTDTTGAVLLAPGIRGNFH
jgi:hypothetical protein